MADPLVIDARCSRDRAFAVDNVVLFLLSIGFVPLFFFAASTRRSRWATSAREAGLYLLVFFGGFAIAAQLGGRILDSRGATPAVVLGCAIAAVGFYLWAEALTGLSFGSSGSCLALAGPASASCSARSAPTRSTAPRTRRYGEVTGITQTVRNFGGSLGLAVLGSLLITENVSRVTQTLGRVGVPGQQANEVAHAISGASGGGGSGRGQDCVARDHAQIQLDFAHSTQTVVYVMAGAMALAFVVALRAMPGGKAEQAETVEAPAPASGADATAGAVPAQVAGTSG